MNDESKKRPRFQLHLSTALVLLFVAGGLTLANCRHNFVRDDPNFTEFGFPFPAIKPIILCAMMPEGCKHIFLRYDVNYPMIATDLAIALGVLIITGYIFETFIRRRGRKN